MWYVESCSLSPGCGAGWRAFSFWVLLVAIWGHFFFFFAGGHTGTFLPVFVATGAKSWVTGVFTFLRSTGCWLQPRLRILTGVCVSASFGIETWRFLIRVSWPCAWGHTDHLFWEFYCIVRFVLTVRGVRDGLPFLCSRGCCSLSWTTLAFVGCR